MSEKNTGAKPKSSKKKVHVPSRYRQAAEKSSVSKSSEEQSRIYPTAGSLENESVFTDAACSQGVTSTPMPGFFFNFLSLDESAVTTSRHFSVPSVGKKNVKRLPNKNQSESKMEDRLHSDDSFDEDTAQEEIDILYAEYLQSCFLLSSARKALQTRCTAAVETLHKLLSLVHQHLEEAKTQKLWLTVMSTLIEVHEHCHKQNGMLKPVLEIIPALEKQYENLAKAIDATKHTLHVKDVVVPDPDDLMKQLEKMSEFLTSFFKDVPRFMAGSEAVDLLNEYANFAEQLTDELQKGVNLMTESQQLSVSEASLALGSKTL